MYYMNAMYYILHFVSILTFPCIVATQLSITHYLNIRTPLKRSEACLVYFIFMHVLLVYKQQLQGKGYKTVTICDI